MTLRLYRWLVVVAFIFVLAVAVPVTAQEINPSVSVTVVSVGLRGADYNFGVIERLTTKSINNPSTGDRTYTFATTTDNLVLGQSRRTMFIFQAETGSLKNGIGFGGSGWTYKSRSQAESDENMKEHEALYIVNQGVYGPTDTQHYLVTASWEISMFDAGLTWNNAMPHANMKIFNGVAYGKIRNGTSIVEDNTSSYSYYSPYQISFNADKSSTSATRETYSTGFGSTSGGTLDVNIGSRVKIRSETKMALLLATTTVTQKLKNHDESVYYDYYASTLPNVPDETFVSHQIGDFSAPFKSTTKDVVVVFQSMTTVTVRLGKGLEAGGGFFLATFHNMAEQDASPTLAGLTGTIAYRW